jgi:SAM-dependent methyltransferase
MGIKNAWRQQWLLFSDIQDQMFHGWIHPCTLETFRDKQVLEAGCGSGRDTALIASTARHVVAVDLNSHDIAKQRNVHLKNIDFINGDIATISLGDMFDVVVCVGVIHHTDHPELTFENLYKHCRPGGLMIIWAYSSEGNALVRFVVEPMRKVFLSWTPRWFVHLISILLTAALYPVVYTIYSIPSFQFLPYYRYFQVFKQIGFKRNMINVFDKLNAPQTHFISAKRAADWFNEKRFVPNSIVIQNHLGVGHTMIGQKRAAS